MKRNFLENLGLNKEQIDAVLDQNGKEVSDIKAKLELSETELSNVEKLQQENKQNKENYDKEIRDLRIDYAIKLAIGDTAQDEALVSSLFDRDILSFDESGSIKGIDEQLNSIKESKSFLFKNDVAEVMAGVRPVESMGQAPKKSVNEMSYDELCTYMESNSNL